MNLRALLGGIEGAVLGGSLKTGRGVDVVYIESQLVGGSEAGC